MKHLRWYYTHYVEPVFCRFPAGREMLHRHRKRAMDNFSIFLISFPKCGRTWLRLMLGKAFALHFGVENADLMELAQIGALSPDFPVIRITHDDNPHLRTPGELIPTKNEYKRKKVILLVRDPRDVVVSLYFERVKRGKGYKGDLSAFIREKRGSTDTIIHFYNIWAQNRHIPSDFLLVRYEEMHANPEKELQRVLNFLGVDEIADPVIYEATQFASFDNMREMERNHAFQSARLRPADRDDPESYKTRKGKVGGFVDYLSEADVEYLNQKMRTQLSSFYGYTTDGPSS